MNASIKKIGIFTALGVGAYFLFSSFKRATVVVTFGKETIFAAKNSTTKGVTTIEVQSYDRQTKKKSHIISKSTVYTLIGTVESSAGKYYITTTNSYLPASALTIRTNLNKNIIDQPVPTNPNQSR